MKITFEYNDDENHIVKWCLYKCATILGCNDGDKDPIEYEHKISISNVWEIPIKFKDIFEKEMEKRDDK